MTTTTTTTPIEIKLENVTTYKAILTLNNGRDRAITADTLDQCKRNVNIWLLDGHTLKTFEAVTTQKLV